MTAMGDLFNTAIRQLFVTDMHQPIRVAHSCKAEITEKKKNLTACRTMMSTIICHYPLLFYSREAKWRCIVSNPFVLSFIATYVVRLQLGLIFKDVSCEVGFLEDFIKRSLILGNKHTHKHKHTKTRKMESGPVVYRKQAVKVTPAGKIVRAIFLSDVNKVIEEQLCIGCIYVIVSLTVSLRCPSVSAV